MRITRPAAVVGIALVALAAAAAPASAHVTIPDPGEKGGFSIVTFSVPNERPDSGTTTFEVKLPEDHPLPFVSVQPKPGWTADTTMRTLDEPVDAFGEEVTEVVDTVTWTGGTIAPGQFDTFSLSVGVLPDDVDSLAFPAIQTYSSGEEVAWIEATPEGGEEPEHPAPVLELLDPAESSHNDGEEATATTVAEDDTDGVAVAALVVAIVAALLGGAALVTGRRRTG
ncbi:MAG: YcnI family protein [Acidimicrobiales bacterium]